MKQMHQWVRRVNVYKAETKAHRLRPKKRQKIKKSLVDWYLLYSAFYMR